MLTRDAIERLDEQLDDAARTVTLRVSDVEANVLLSLVRAEDAELRSLDASYASAAHALLSQLATLIDDARIAAATA